MIAPEPTEHLHDEMYHYPSDEGRQTRFLRTLITVEDGVGAAGHLGVIEERCENPAGHEEIVFGLVDSCPACGAGGTDMPPGIWGVNAEDAPIAKRGLQPR